MENEEINFANFIVIPTEVLCDTELSLGAKLLYGVVVTLTKKEGYCFAGNSYIAKILNVSADTISRWFSELVKTGYVNVEYKKDKQRGSTLRYATLNISFKKDPISKITEGGLGKNADTGLGKNAEYNNINLNNISDKSDDLSLAKEKPSNVQKTITDTYCEVYQKVFGQKFVPVSKDYWVRVSRLIKTQLKRFSVEQLCSAITMAKNDKWVISKGFDLNIILSTNMIERYLNPNYQINTKSDKRSDSYDWDKFE